MSQRLCKPTRRGHRIFTIGPIKKNGESSLPPPPSPPDPKCAIRFDVKSDEDIVYGSDYKFNVDIDTLINNSKKTRVAIKNEKKGTNQTPRRQNAWILYRRDKSLNAEFNGLKSSIVSLEVREMWRNEKVEIKELFAALSRLAEKRHIEKYGEDYKYKPNHVKKKINKKNHKISNKKRPTPKETKPNNYEYFATTIDYFNLSSPENETIIESPHQNNKDINTSSTTDFLPTIRDDIWQDPILQFKLDNEYSFINNFRDIDEINEINENLSENNETETLYGIFS
jgi:hypothetical protein